MLRSEVIDVVKVLLLLERPPYKVRFVVLNLLHLLVLEVVLLLRLERHVVALQRLGAEGVLGRS